MKFILFRNIENIFRKKMLMKLLSVNIIKVVIAKRKCIVITTTLKKNAKKEFAEIAMAF